MPGKPTGKLKPDPANTRYSEHEQKAFQALIQDLPLSNKGLDERFADCIEAGEALQRLMSRTDAELYGFLAKIYATLVYAYADDEIEDLCDRVDLKTDSGNPDLIPRLVRGLIRSAYKAAESERYSVSKWALTVRWALRKSIKPEDAKDFFKNQGIEESCVHLRKALEVEDPPQRTDGDKEGGQRPRNPSPPNKLGLKQALRIVERNKERLTKQDETVNGIFQMSDLADQNYEELNEIHRKCSLRIIAELVEGKILVERIIGPRPRDTDQIKKAVPNSKARANGNK
jgi:hypothetical protein